MSRFRFPIAMFLSAVVLATGTWSCGSSKSAAKTAYEQSPGNNKGNSKKDKKRPLPPGARIEVQKALVTKAREWIGTPYVYGGDSKKGADCSGFIMSLYRDAVGIKLPRNSAAQKDFCVGLDKDRIEVGDLVFFSSPRSGSNVAHVGMYVGDNTFIHSSSSKGVIESDLSQKYYVTHFRGIGRVPAIAEVLPVEKGPEALPQPEQPQLALESKPSAKSSNTKASAPVIAVADTKPTPTQVKTVKVTEPAENKEPGTNIQAAQPDIDPETMVANAFAGR